jgi:hypothetical protein
MPFPPLARSSSAYLHFSCCASHSRFPARHIVLLPSHKPLAQSTCLQLVWLAAWHAAAGMCMLLLKKVENKVALSAHNQQHLHDAVKNS